MRSTETPSMIRAPFSFATAAKAMVVSMGEVWPSPGSQTPPWMPSGFSSGQRSTSSSGPMTSTSTSKHLAMSAPRTSSSSRSALPAMLTDPTFRKPVGWPISFSSRS